MNALSRLFGKRPKNRDGNENIAQTVARMQYSIDEYARFCEHLFIALKKDAKRDAIIFDDNVSGLFSPIMEELEIVLKEAGRIKSKEGE